MNTYNIQALVDSPSEFDRTKSELKNLILKDFKIRHEKCKIEVANEEIEITNGQLLLNLFLLSLFKGLNEKIEKDDLFLKDSISGDDIENYLNHVLERIKKDEIDFDAYRKSVCEFLNEASDISADTNILAGNTIDFLDFVDSEIEDPETVGLFGPPTVENLQFSDIEDIFNKRGKDIVKYFDNHPNRNLSTFTRSKTGINVKQMTQTLG